MVTLFQTDFRLSIIFLEISKYRADPQVSAMAKERGNQVSFDLSLRMNPTASIAMPPTTAPVNNWIVIISALVGTLTLPLPVTTRDRVGLQKEPAQRAANQADEAVPPKTEPMLVGRRGGDVCAKQACNDLDDQVGKGPHHVAFSLLDSDPILGFGPAGQFA
jgi:hypothetical protein